jgi:hypothetical protein
MPDFGVVPPSAPAERRVLEIRIAPVTGGHELDHLDVALRFSEPPGEFGEPAPLVLWLPDADGGDGGWPSAIEEMYARDAEGALTLRSHPARRGPAASVPVMEWRSDRRPVGPIHIGYRVHLAPSAPGQYQGTRTHAAGFEGTGATFLVLPDAADAYHVRLTWDLASAGEGARAISSLDAETSAPLERLRDATFMAGPLGRISIDDGRSRFEGAWLGHAGFDPLVALPWVARAWEAGRATFHDPASGAFTTLLRTVPGEGRVWTTTPQLGGLRVLAGEQVPFDRAARASLARGLVRRWIGGDAGIHFEGPEATSRWFTEGVAAHVARELLLRARLATPDEVLVELNAPPPPGMLYAADVDAAVRAASGGKRSLDDLVLTLLAKARAGARPGEGSTPPLPAAAWRELVGDVLGPQGPARFDAAIGRGEPLDLPPDAFGPCFKLAKKVLPRGSGKAGARAGAAPAAPVWVRDPRAPASCAGHAD